VFLTKEFALRLCFNPTNSLKTPVRFTQEVALRLCFHPTNSLNKLLCVFNYGNFLAIVLLPNEFTQKYSTIFNQKTWVFYLAILSTNICDLTQQTLQLPWDF
jgi:hypothetical protein